MNMAYTAWHTRQRFWALFRAEDCPDSYIFWADSWGFGAILIKFEAFFGPHFEQIRKVKSFHEKHCIS